MGSAGNCSSAISALAGKEFSIIIVGGGTAGLVLANRLTEDPNVNVLVVEAGAERLSDPKILTPGMMGALYKDPAYDWDYSTEPQVEDAQPSFPCPCFNRPRGAGLRQPSFNES
jgi:choline dehydrogenase-like flavoprotein